jgi:hypothetical protein
MQRCPQNAFVGTASFRLGKFLGAFPKLRKATVSFVCLHVRPQQLGSHRTDFHRIWYLSIFRKSVEKIQLSLKSDQNNAYLHKHQYVFLIMTRSVLLRMRNAPDIVVDKNNTRI